jgi:hypothetical protein
VKSNGSANGHAGVPVDGTAIEARSNGNGHVRKIRIRLERTSDRQADLRRVVEIYSVLQQFGGQDEVELVVCDGMRELKIPLPNRLAGYCSALVAGLGGLVDAKDVSVDGAPVAT